MLRDIVDECFLCVEGAIESTESQIAKTEKMKNDLKLKNNWSTNILKFYILVFNGSLLPGFTATARAHESR